MLACVVTRPPRSTAKKGKRAHQDPKPWVTSCEGNAAASPCSCTPLHNSCSSTHRSPKLLVLHSFLCYQANPITLSFPFLLDQHSLWQLFSHLLFAHHPPPILPLLLQTQLFVCPSVCCSSVSSFVLLSSIPTTIFIFLHLLERPPANLLFLFFFFFVSPLQQQSTFWIRSGLTFPTLTWLWWESYEV